MLEAFVIFMAILIAGAVVGGGGYYLWRENRRIRQGQADHFRAALLSQLRKGGVAGLDLEKLIIKCEVPMEVVQSTTAKLYGEYCSKALMDAGISATDRKRLEAVQSALAIPMDLAQSIEIEIKEDRYRQAALTVLPTGTLTADAANHLEMLRNRYGLIPARAFQITELGATDGYLALFRRILLDGQITPQKLEELRIFRKAAGMPHGVANDIIRDDVMNVYRQRYCDIVNKLDVTPEDEKQLAWLRDQFGLRQRDTEKHEAHIKALIRHTAYRNGHLPRVATNKLLEAGEICHWQGRCRFQWETATQVKDADGELIVTSQRLVFTSPLRSFDFAPSKIIEIQMISKALVIGNSSNRGVGSYFVSRPSELEAILLGLTRLHKYQLTIQSELSRHITDTVRQAVWQRDGGKCVKCGAIDYLEYDHIIPHSRGGANTVANIQILCRRCNNNMSDRI